MDRRSQQWHGYPEASHAWLIVAALLLAYVFSFIDRMLLSLLVDPIKRDLGISDTQISLLQGFAFAVFYTLFGLPMGWLVDRYHRIRIITIGISVWSVMTALCGMATTYWQLFLARMGVGIGEATLSPAAYSIISDIFPKKRLGTALGVYNMGSAIGGGLAMIIGGVVVKLVSQTGVLSIPLLGQIYPWQLTFICVGLPGLLVAGLIYCIHEPQRREIIPVGEKPMEEAVSLSEVIMFVKENRILIFLHHSAVALAHIALFGVVSWFPVFLMRVYVLPVEQAGLAVGLALILGGVIGLIGGGWLGDKLSQSAGLRGRAGLCFWTCLSVLPVAAVFSLTDSPLLSILMFMLIYIGGIAPIVTSIAILQEISPARMRGILSAFYLFVINVTGIGLGATFVALLSDYIFTGAYGLRYSMSVIAVIFYAAAALCFYCLLKHIHTNRK